MKIPLQNIPENIILDYLYQNRMSIDEIIETFHECCPSLTDNFAKLLEYIRQNQVTYHELSFREGIDAFICMMLNSIKILEMVLSNEYFFDVSVIDNSALKAALLSHCSEREFLDWNLIKELLELDNDEITHLISWLLLGASDIDAEKVSELVFQYFENLIRVVDQDMICLLSCCSYDCFPYELLSLSLVTLIRDCIGLYTEKSLIILSKSLSNRLDVCLFKDQLSDINFMNYALYGNFAVRKAACDLLITMYAHSVFSSLWDFLDSGFLTSLVDFIQSGIDENSSVTYIECIGEVLAQTYLLGENDYTLECIRCLEELSRDDNETIANKARYELSINM